MKKLEYRFGNYTSQYFANIYLNELDQYIKRDLHIKYFVRYMDDFILLVPTKKDCIILKEKIKTFLNDILHLELNEKTRYYPNKMGVNFCGYRIFPTHMLLRNSFKKKFKKNLKKWNIQYSKNKLNFKKMIAQFNSCVGHIKHCNSYNFKKYIISKGNFFYKDNNS